MTPLSSLVKIDLRMLKFNDYKGLRRKIGSHCEYGHPDSQIPH